MTNKDKSAFLEYLKKKAQREVLSHLDQKAWIKNLLDKHIWLEHQTAYPSVVGKAIGDMIGREIEQQQKSNELAYIYNNKKKVTKQFLKRHERINQHINTHEHSQALELLFGLALLIIQKELKDFQQFNIHPQKQLDGGTPDFIIEIPWIINICIDLKNRFSNFSEDNAREIIRKYAGANTVQMVIHPSLTKEAQSIITDNNGFFCNIGRIYTGYYDGIIDDLREEGIERGTVIIKGDITKIYRDLKDDIRGKNFKFHEKAKEVFTNEPLNYFLRKIRGIVRYAVLKNYFKTLERRYEKESQLGLMNTNKMTEKEKELLRAIPHAYFIFLFQPETRITVSTLADSLTRYPELKYFKKVDTKRKRDFARNAATFLQKNGFIKKESKDKWYAGDIESPYHTRRDSMDKMEIIEI